MRANTEMSIVEDLRAKKNSLKLKSQLKVRAPVSDMFTLAELQTIKNKANRASSPDKAELELSSVKVTKTNSKQIMEKVNSVSLPQGIQGPEADEHKPQISQSALQLNLTLGDAITRFRRMEQGQSKALERGGLAYVANPKGTFN